MAPQKIWPLQRKKLFLIKYVNIFSSQGSSSAWQAAVTQTTQWDLNTNFKRPLSVNPIPLKTQTLCVVLLSCLGLYKYSFDFVNIILCGIYKPKEKTTHLLYLQKYFGDHLKMANMGISCWIIKSSQILKFIFYFSML